jgi:hypothetical protein
VYKYIINNLIVFFLFSITQHLKIIGLFQLFSRPLWTISVVRVCVCIYIRVHVCACVCVRIVDMLMDRRSGGPRRGATRCNRQMAREKNIIIVVVILIIMIMYYLDDSLSYLPSRRVFSRVRDSRYLSERRRLVELNMGRHRIQ